MQGIVFRYSTLQEKVMSVFSMNQRNASRIGWAILRHQVIPKAATARRLGGIEGDLEAVREQSALPAVVVRFARGEKVHVGCKTLQHRLDKPIEVSLSHRERATDAFDQILLALQQCLRRCGWNADARRRPHRDRFVEKGRRVKCFRVGSRERDARRRVRREPVRELRSGLAEGPAEKVDEHPRIVQARNRRGAP